MKLHLMAKNRVSLVIDWKILDAVAVSERTVWCFAATVDHR